MTEKLIALADRAKALLDAKNDHQLAVELVAAQDRIEQLAAQLADATRQCGVMTELLRDARSHIEDSVPYTIGEHYAGCDLIDSINETMAGKLPDHPEQPLAMVPECPEVVGYRRPGTECLFNDTTHPENNEALMTVAQHERIMLAMLAAAPKPEGA